MSTYKDLPAYKDLLKKVSLDGGRTIAFVGAGLSKASGLPDWTGLRDSILDDYKADAAAYEESERKRIINACNHAKGIVGLWNSFSEIKKIRPQPVFESTIRRHLGGTAGKKPPQNYNRLWQMGIEGLITLNLDDFSQRAYSETKPGNPLLSFTGFQISNYVDVLSHDAPFLCNLHGRIAEGDSWVFSSEDHKELKKVKGYKEFFDACFLTASIVFVGVSAEDVSAGGILSELLKSVRRTVVGDHYWISDRSDSIASSFADENGLKRIHYCSKDNHAELDSILDDLRNKKFQLPVAEVVVPSGKKTRNFVKSTVDELIKIQDPNELRIKLNSIATNILQSGSSTRISDYEAFVDEYEMLIARAWFIPKNAKTKFFDYDLKRLISGDGAFGRVYEAKGEDGKTCAIKIIHDAVHGDPAMLEAFRRGVSSMKIVAKQGVPGVVAIKDAWEMPASIVMNYIDGLNLEQAIEDRVVDDWGERLSIFESLANVLLSAHRLPEVVVHRDVRPPNVILQGLYSKGDKFAVNIVDFDLSWHRDALGKSVQHKSNLHGYFAPEQYESLTKATSRSALVDSYGLSMTIFYVVTRRHPRFGETERADWKNNLFQSFRILRCDSWKSIPTRLARLVYRGSILDQTKRADMTTFSRELNWLSNLYQKNSAGDIRLVLDEIGHRSEILHGMYDWDEQEGVAKYVSPSGLSLYIRRIERSGIELSAEWSNSGGAHYKSLKKYIDNATKDIVSRLRGNRWKCETDTNFDGMRVVAIKTLDLKKLVVSDVDGYAQDVDFLASRLSFKG